MADWPSSRYPSSAETYEYVPEQWSSEVIEAVKKNLVCVGAVDTHWREQLAKGDILHIPVGSSLTGGSVDVTSDYGGNLNTDFGAAAETLTIDQWDEVPVQIDDGTLAQTQVEDLPGILGRRAGYELAKLIDTDVNALFASSITTTWRGSDGQTFNDDLLLDLMEGLNNADVPPTERFLITSPYGLRDMFGIDKFIHRDYNRTLTGEMGMTPYGDPILVTTNLTAASVGCHGAYLQRQCIGLAIQKQFKLDNYYWHQRHSQIINVSAIWGSDVLRSTFGASYYTRDGA